MHLKDFHHSSRLLVAILLSCILLTACAGNNSGSLIPAAAPPGAHAAQSDTLSFSNPSALVTDTLDGHHGFVARNEPSDTDNLYDLLLAELALRRGHYDVALQHYYRQIYRTQDSTVAALTTYLAQQLNDEPIALDAAQRWAQLAPDQAEAHYIAATLLVNHQRPAEALQRLAQWRQQYADHNAELSIYFYLLESDILLNAQRFDEAHQLLSEALLIHPKQANLLYARVLANEQRQQYLPMIDDLTLLVEQEPNNAMALNALGYTLADQNLRLDEAYDLIKRALQLKPDSPHILDSLGWVEYRRGNSEQARLWLEQAYRIAKHHEIAAHYGEVLWQLGQQEQAYEVWQQGLEGDPNSPVINEAINRLTGNGY